MSVIVESLHTYPVKGLRGIDWSRAAVGRLGLDGDRRWLATDPTGHFLTQRQVARMAQVDTAQTEDGLLLRHGSDSHRVRRPDADAPRLAVSVWRDRLSAACAGPTADAFLSRVLGVEARLVYLDDECARPVHPDFAAPGDHVSFADGFPMLATSHASLSALNLALQAGQSRPVPMARFRPNLTLSGLPPFAEDRWRRVRIGSMLFRAPKPCTRCIVVTRDQGTGAILEPGEPLRTLARLNPHPMGVVFGANLIPEAPGMLAVGDRFELLETL